MKSWAKGKEWIRAESAPAHRSQEKQRSMFTKRASLFAWGCVIRSEAFFDRARGLPESSPGRESGDRAANRSGYCFFPPRAGVEALPDLSTAAACRGQVTGGGSVRRMGCRFRRRRSSPCARTIFACFACAGLREKMCRVGVPCQAGPGDLICGDITWRVLCLFFCY